MCIYTYIHIYDTLMLASSHLSSTSLLVCQTERSRRATDVYTHSSSTHLYIHTCLCIHSPSKHSSSNCLSSTRLYIHCTYTLAFDSSIYTHFVYIYTHPRNTRLCLVCLQLVYIYTVYIRIYTLIFDSSTSVYWSLPHQRFLAGPTWVSLSHFFSPCM